MLLFVLLGPFGAGRIGVAQVHVLAKLAANRRCRDQLAGSEQVLLNAARELQFEDFKIVCQRWEQLADADGTTAAPGRSSRSTSRSGR